MCTSTTLATPACRDGDTWRQPSLRAAARRRYPSKTMAREWTPDSWQRLRALQQPSYPDPTAVDRVVAELACLPPLVTSWEIERLKALLLERLGSHPHVGEIRGRGLLVGVELVADRETRAPFPRG